MLADASCGTGVATGPWDALRGTPGLSSTRRTPADAALMQRVPTSSGADLIPPWNHLSACTAVCNVLNPTSQSIFHSDNHNRSRESQIKSRARSANGQRSSTHAKGNSYHVNTRTVTASQLERVKVRVGDCNDSPSKRKAHCAGQYRGHGAYEVEEGEQEAVSGGGGGAGEKGVLGEELLQYIKVLACPPLHLFSCHPLNPLHAPASLIDLQSYVRGTKPLEICTQQVQTEPALD